MKPSHRRPRRNRRGFALIMVIIFLFFMLSLMALTFHQIASVLRLEAARAARITNYEVDLRAAALVLDKLEENNAEKLVTLVSTDPATCGVKALIDPDYPASLSFHYDVKIFLKGDASKMNITKALVPDTPYTVTVTRSGP